MAGDMFQRTYKHEIPREKDAMFTRLCTIIPPQISSDLEKADLARADWLAANPEEVRRLSPRDYQNYLEWSRARYSYTIRFFAAQSSK